MVPREQTQALVEGAFFASLTAVFSLISMYVPVISFFAVLAGPMPTAVLVKKYNLKIAMLSLVSALLITVLFFGNPLAALLVTLEAGAFGLIIGLLMKKNIPAGFSIVIASIGSFLLTFLSYLIAFAITGNNPFNIGNEVRQTVADVYEMYRNNGLLSGMSQKELNELKEGVVNTVIMFLPGSLTIGAMVSGSINYLLTRELFKRLNYEVVNIKPFSYLQFPWYTIWGVILGIALLLTGDNLHIAALSIVSKNILYVCSFLFSILGFSIVVFYTNKFKFSKIIKIIILFIAMIYWPLTMALFLSVGILDPYFDFRRLVVNK